MANRDFAMSCPVCGSPDAACGTNHPDGVAVVDVPVESGRSYGGADMVTVRAYRDDGVEYAFRMTAGDAKREGFEVIDPAPEPTPKPAAKAKKPTTKKRTKETARDKARAADGDKVKKKPTRKPAAKAPASSSK